MMKPDPRPALESRAAVAGLSLTVVLVLGFACSRAKQTGTSAQGGNGAAAHIAGTPPTDKVIEAITRSTGLRGEGFAVLQPVPFGAGRCEQGRIAAIDTLVCEFPDDSSLDRGKKLIQEQWGRDGVQTGVATATQRTLLGIADRGHHDPNGKTISQILAAFRKI